jgi:DNA-directed RNA polymerase specialized sigma subunit, sigma24 homolog
MLERMCMNKVARDSAHRDLVFNSVQDTFMLAHQSYNELVHHPNIEAWLKTVCNNRLKPYAKRLREAQGHAISLELLDSNQLRNEQDVGERVLFDISTQEMVDELVSLLSKTEKVIFQLYFIEHNTIEEIAKARNSSTNNVKVVLSHIRTKAKKIMDKNISNLFIFFLTFWVFRYFN